MDNVTETKDEPRKDWAAPELKKINIEAITANFHFIGNDGHGLGTGS